jgi:hypothetical protein
MDFDHHIKRGVTFVVREDSGDFESLADLGNSYEVVREMRLVPFGEQDISRLATATAAPLVPLGLTVLSLEEIVMRLLKVLV